MRLVVLVYITSWGSVLPNTSCGTMPTCPHSQCPCGHKNVSAEALISHVQSSPWAPLYFCATCKCVCKSETVLIHVGALLCVSEGPPMLMDGIVAQAEGSQDSLCHRSISPTSGVFFGRHFLPNLRQAIQHHKCARAALPRHPRAPKVHAL